MIQKNGNSANGIKESPSGKMQEASKPSSTKEPREVFFMMDAWCCRWIAGVSFELNAQLKLY